MSKREIQNKGRRPHNMQTTNSARFEYKRKHGTNTMVWWFIEHNVQNVTIESLIVMKDTGYAKPDACHVQYTTTLCIIFL